MTKWNLGKRLSDHNIIHSNRILQRLSRFLHHPDLWHISHHSLAGGVAVGLFVAFIPLPIQMLLAAVLALIFRVNLPVAILMTWVSNPVTFVPICWAAYKVGQWVTQSNGIPIVIPEFQWHTETWQGFMHSFYTWFSALGKTFLIGLPIVAFTASLLAYVGVHILWQVYSRFKKAKP
jgi:uncharacterized protein (DUF2062 family)